MSGASAPSVTVPRFEAQNLTREFRSGSGETLAALRDVTVVVPRGAYVLVTGPSGSGKTTLLAVLGTLENPGSGTVRVDGVDVARMSESARSAARRKIGFVFPGGPMLAGLPLWENVTLGLVPSGAGVKERQAIATRLLEPLGLGGRLRAKPGELSTGELQRACLARARAAGADALLVDEPTANLDDSTAAAVIEILRSHHAAGGTLVIATHDPAAFPFATEVVRLELGRRASSP